MKRFSFCFDTNACKRERLAFHHGYYSIHGFTKCVLIGIIFGNVMCLSRAFVLGN